MTKGERDDIELKFTMLEKHHVPERNGKLETTGDRISVHTAFGAMDDYAREIAIGFAKWVNYNDYEDCQNPNGWVSMKQKNNEPLTAEQLFTQYLNTLTQ